VIVAGVDGCPGGWLAAFRRADGTGPVTARVAAAFADLAGDAATIAVDMPIGLPERVAGGGRGPEQAIRPLLGARQSSVFAIPARAAVYAVDPHPEGLAAQLAAHREASAVALALSVPPRKISIQGFHLFPKIRELDRWLRADPARADRVREVHPEAAFWRMNGERPLAAPKKARGRPHPEGLAERRALLLAEGLPPEAVGAPPPPGAGADDWLDALACLVAATRLAEGRGRPHPDPFPRDGFGLPVAIWTWA
jgi:predicted RNase H-like nuclease